MSEATNPDDEVDEFFRRLRERTPTVDNRYQPGPDGARLNVYALSYGPALSEITRLMAAVIGLSKLCDERGPDGTVTTRELATVLGETRVEFTHIGVGEPA